MQSGPSWVNPETLLKIGNIVSTLFLAESRYDLDAMLAELVALFDREEDKQAVSLLVNWFRQMALYKRIPQEEYARVEDVYRSSEEVQTMLVTTFDTLYLKVREEGREEGIEQGLEISRAKTVLAMTQDRRLNKLMIYLPGSGHNHFVTSSISWPLPGRLSKLFDRHSSARLRTRTDR